MFSCRPYHNNNSNNNILVLAVCLMPVPVVGLQNRFWPTVDYFRNIFLRLRLVSFTRREIFCRVSFFSIPVVKIKTLKRVHHYTHIKTEFHIRFASKNIWTILLKTRKKNIRLETEKNWLVFFFMCWFSCQTRVPEVIDFSLSVYY